jgi:hypothetical protein
MCVVCPGCREKRDVGTDVHAGDVVSYDACSRCVPSSADTRRWHVSLARDTAGVLSGMWYHAPVAR